MSACDGTGTLGCRGCSVCTGTLGCRGCSVCTGTLGCRGCSVCADHRRTATATHRSTPTPPAYRTPEWVAEQKAREARLRLVPAGQRWAQAIVPEPEY